jgi:phosphoribosylformimino-5-aminoimidazole carboxamide ribotide isomerase
LFDRFTVIPAIDLKAGKVVRLLRGDMEQATVYGDDPAAVARGFENAGATVLHVVDLDGAVAGEPRNLAAIEAIRSAVRCTIEASGGLRNLESIERCVRAGANRIAIGSAAFSDPDLLLAACRALPGRVLGSLDVRDGRVAVKGWTETSSITVEVAVQRFRDAGVAAIIFTDISRDGTRTGVDAGAIGAFARWAQMPVIASGGVANLNDIAELAKQFEHGVVGVVVGRALYEGDITLSAIDFALGRDR